MRNASIMEHEVKDNALSHETGSSDTTPVAHFTQLASDVRALANAELDYYRARLSYSKDVAKSTGLYLAIAIFALFGTVTALILGTLLILSVLIGPLLATIAVTISFAAMMIIFAYLARRSARNFAFSEISNKSAKQSEDHPRSPQ